MLALFTTIFSLIVTILICYYLKVNWYFYILIYIATYIISVILTVGFCYILAILLEKKNGEIIKPKRIFNYLTFIICKYVMLVSNIRVKKIGFEEVEDKEFLLVSNHQSMMDPLTIIASLPNIGLGFIMRENILKIPVIGRFLVSAGFFPINRENNREGLKTIIKATHRLENGSPVGVFPEGTRSKGPELGSFREGTFKISLRSKKDILVVAIDNEYNIHENAPFKRTNVSLINCGRLKYEDIKDMNTTEISEKVHLMMEEGLEKIRMCK